MTNLFFRRYSKPIVLPLIKPRIHSKQVFQLEDNVAVMHALLQSNQFERAEKVFHQLLSSKFTQPLLNANMFNLFIAAYVDKIRGNQKQMSLENAMCWFSKMNIHGVEANATTLALVLQGLLHAGYKEEATKFVETKITPELKPLVFEQLNEEQKLEFENASYQNQEFTGRMGMQILKSALQTVQEEKEEISNYAQQLQMEQNAYDGILKRIKNETEIESTLRLSSNKTLNQYVVDWHKSYSQDLKSIEDPLVLCCSETLGLERISIICICELLPLFSLNRGARSVSILEASLALGRAIMTEMNMQNICKTKNNSRKLILGQQLFQMNRLQSASDRYLFSLFLEMKKDINESSLDDEDSEDRIRFRWSKQTTIKVGTLLLDCLLKSANVVVEDNVIPAFFQTIEHTKAKSTGVLKMNSHVLETIASSSLSNNLSPKMLPMLVPPRPWLNYTSGGYLASRSACMRFYQSNQEQRQYLKACSDGDRLTKVLSALDVLGNVPWRVNKKLLPIVLHYWNSGIEIGGLPQLFTKEKTKKERPQKPIEKEKMQKYYSELRKFRKIVSESFSQRCSTNYTIEIAKSLQDKDLYFPHNIDFRGRAYPVPLFLNHMSNDLCRGLLKFKEKKKLGENGWKWLRIHLASLYGCDKLSFDKRLEFVELNMQNILESAQDPLKNQWWLNCDEPWQVLAVCFEINDAHLDPINYMSSYPIHQDGSCNGLQHYAALGRDLNGAMEVNLIDQNEPNDVYSKIASKVKQKCAMIDSEIAKKALSLISRKVIKQTVMTNVYGVTRFGAKDQIHQKLKDLTSEDSMELAWFITDLCFKSFGEIFKGAEAIQKWLNVVARIISYSVPEHSKSLISPVIWTTPLGLTCVQPYRDQKKLEVETSIQKIIINNPYNPGKIDSKKQSAAFPPNFIHSLDATHMMMTALECNLEKITFAAVHDSFWTHACDVDQMNVVIRRTFLQLHQQDILGDFLKECEMRYRNHLICGKRLKKMLGGKHKGMVNVCFPPIPSKGTLDINCVLNSKYFFH